MNTHAYIRTENISLDPGEIKGVEQGLTQAVEASSKSQDQETIITSFDGTITITESLYNDGLLTAWVNTQQANPGVSGEVFLTAAECRQWLRDNPDFYPHRNLKGATMWSHSLRCNQL